MLSNEYNIIEASHGNEAPELLQGGCRGISAVILSSHIMQTDNGELLARMKSDGLPAHIPIVVAMERTDVECEEKALTMGADDFISLPCSAVVLKQRMERIITLSEGVSEIHGQSCDILTGLLSRETFFNNTAEMTALHEPGYYVMACFNIDNFKVVNDQYGTDMGDRVLRHVAISTEKCADSLEGICCRIMADNFAMLYRIKTASALSSGEPHF